MRKMNVLKASIAGIGILTLTGCASLSGLDASSDFQCKAQPGVSCESVSGTYQNAMDNNLPSQRAEIEKQGGFVIINNPDVKKASFSTKETSVKPMISPPKMLRVWIAPWSDKNNVLHDQSHSYLMVQKATWNVEHFEDNGNTHKFFSR
jgi:conjugal transfer pilus assembly protein TraV